MTVCMVGDAPEPAGESTAVLLGEVELFHLASGQPPRQRRQHVFPGAKAPELYKFSKLR